MSVFTGASTGPELDGALAMAGGINLRLPYQSDPETRKRINAGEMEYMDIHLSHVAQFVEYGFLGKLDVALIEVAAVLEDGRLLPSSSIGNNKTWIDQAERVILEVNAWQPMALEGMHDIYYGLQPPPNRGPIPLVHRGTADWIAVSRVSAGEGGRDRADGFARPEQPVQSAGRSVEEDRRTHPGVSELGSEEGTHAGEPAAAAVGRGQHRQRGAVWAGRRAVRGADVVHGSDSGRHDSAAEVGQADLRLGDGVFA